MAAHDSACPWDRFELPLVDAEAVLPSLFHLAYLAVDVEVDEVAKELVADGADLP